MRMLGRLLILGCLCGVIAPAGFGQAQAQNADPVTPLIAVDSVGKQIGQVLRMDLSLNRMQVAMQVEGKLVFVTMGKDSFTHLARPYVYFDGAGCTGTAYMASEPSTNMFGAPSAVAGPNQTLFLGEGNEQTASISSMLRGSTCEVFEATIPVLVATPKLDLAYEFTAPYEILKWSDAAGEVDEDAPAKPGRRKR